MTASQGGDQSERENEFRKDSSLNLSNIKSF